MKVDGKEFKEGDWITIDGTTGEVFEGQVETIAPEMSTELTDFLSWADDIRLADQREGLSQKGFLVRTNADQPADAKTRTRTRR